MIAAPSPMVKLPMNHLSSSQKQKIVDPKSLKATIACNSYGKSKHYEA
jgi:hypothetical protein